MSTAHPVEHEELLIAVLAGERDHATREFQHLLATCPACRERWERARPVAERLARAGEDERHALAAALAGEEAPGEDHVSATLDDLVRSEPWRRPRSRPWLWLAAAGLLAAFGAWWYAGSGRERMPEVDVPLGEEGSAPRLIEPVGKVSAFERFRWEYDDPDATFLLTLREEAAQGEPGRVVREIQCGGDKEWKPDIELPLRIHWEVVVLDEFGMPVPGSSRSASAWR